MEWTKFIAEHPNPQIQKFINDEISALFLQNNLTDKHEIEIFINAELLKYNQNNAPYLDKIIAIDIFKPEEIDITPFESQINLFRHWLSEQEFNFNETSENLKKIIKNKFSTYPVTIKGTRRCGVVLKMGIAQDPEGSRNSL